MDLFSHPCLCCASKEVARYNHYKTQAHGSRTIYHCPTCDIYFSETFATPPHRRTENPIESDYFKTPQ